MPGIRSLFSFRRRGRRRGRGGGLGTTEYTPTTTHKHALFLSFLFNSYLISLSNLPSVPGDIAQSHRNPRRVKLILFSPKCLPPSVVGPIKTSSSHTYARFPLGVGREGNRIIKYVSRRFGDNTDRIKMNLWSVNHSRERARVLCVVQCV